VAAQRHLLQVSTSWTDQWFVTVPRQVSRGRAELTTSGVNHLRFHRPGLMGTKKAVSE
jgi:hypothetical protein